MRYCGLTTVFVLTCGLVLAAAGQALADTKPASATTRPGTTLGQVEEKAHTTGSTTGDANSVGGKKQPPPATQATPTEPPYVLFILMGGVILMWVLMGRGKRKEAAKRKEMLSHLKKGDKIVSIGGIIGTVIEAKPEEITVKVDETNNVRMKFARWAIRGVGEEAKTTGPDDDKK